MEYAIHILKCSLWDWEGIKDINLRNIAKHGPYKEACDAVTEADVNIPQLKRAIEFLNTPYHQKLNTAI